MYTCLTLKMAIPHICTRFQEHLGHSHFSNFSDHLLVSGHDPKKVQTDILKFEEGWAKLNVIETIEIDRAFQDTTHLVLNDKPGPHTGSLVKWLGRQYSHSPHS